MYTKIENGIRVVDIEAVDKFTHNADKETDLLFSNKIKLFNIFMDNVFTEMGFQLGDSEELDEFIWVKDILRLKMTRYYFSIECKTSQADVVFDGLDWKENFCTGKPVGFKIGQGDYFLNLKEFIKTLMLQIRLLWDETNNKERKQKC